ncbi:MAG: aminoglycoside phosphotransferase family protein [Oscillospiraceae bacterium]|jgi:aminoglycoside phosphotransferase (APT) family kinase protein|nr:aminoglycoside phosphotransferase family protein [Oscillospiraceae bacterium]
MEQELQLIAQRLNKALYRRGEETIKLFDDCIAAPDVLSEALNQARAQQTGLPVPRLHEVTKCGGKWAIISDFIEGENMWTLMQAARPADALMERFVELQMRVHGTTFRQFTDMRAKYQRKISASGLDATTRYELHNRLDAMPRHDKICHGDFVPSNIILRDGAPFIIDWAHVTQGNAAADAANTWLAFMKIGETELAERYIKYYCEKSDTARQYVQKWTPIVAASKLAKCAEADRAFYVLHSEV